MTWEALEHSPSARGISSEGLCATLSGTATKLHAPSTVLLKLTGAAEDFGGTAKDPHTSSAVRFHRS